jgi:hypothetical protein
MQRVSEKESGLTPRCWTQIPTQIELRTGVIDALAAVSSHIRTTVEENEFLEAWRPEYCSGTKRPGDGHVC